MDQFSAHLDRGWDLFGRGDLQGAMVSAEKSLELDSDSPEAHNLAGSIHQAEGRVDEALEHYRHSIELDEDNLEAILNTSELMVQAGRHEEALAMLEEALELVEADEDVADTQLLKLDILLQRDDKKAARQLVERLPEGPFDNPHLHCLVGRAHFEVGLPDAARGHLEVAAERDPANPEAFYYLGLVLEHLGDRRGASLALLRAREADAGLPAPPWSLSLQQFEQVLRNALARLPENLSETVRDALIVVVDLPGPEVVAEGVDPYAGALADGLLDGAGEPLLQPEVKPAKTTRLFVYQKNVERAAGGVLDLENELLRVLETELQAAFPHMKVPASAEAPAHGSPEPSREANSWPPDPESQPPDAN